MAAEAAQVQEARDWRNSTNGRNRYALLTHSADFSEVLQNSQSQGRRLSRGLDFLGPGVDLSVV